jgi:hypothetical protein
MRPYNAFGLQFSYSGRGDTPWRSPIKDKQRPNEKKTAGRT